MPQWFLKKKPKFLFNKLVIERDLKARKPLPLLERSLLPSKKWIRFLIPKKIRSFFILLLVIFVERFG